MKILYSCLSKSWGGMEMYTLTAVKQLLKHNIKVELLCIAESRIHIEANNLGILLHPVKVSGYFNPSAVLKVSALIRKGRYNLIHTQASKDLWVIVPALRMLKSRIPLFFTKHVGSFVKKKDFLHQRLYERVDYAFAISNMIKKNLIETCPLPEDKVILLYDGISMERFNPERVKGDKVREEFNISPSEIVIGMLARFSPGKGHEEFLTAAAELNKKHTNLKFLVVGEASRGEGEYEETIKKTAADKNIDNIIFTGYRSDTPEVLAAMDIFVFPSHSEAFGIALVEAMAMGKPTAASSSDGVLDIAADGETSLMFKPKNAGELADRIDYLLNNPEERKRLGSAAAAHVRQKFDLEVVTGQVIKLYRSALKV